MRINNEFILQCLALLILYFGLLPLVPDFTLGPHNAINPHDILKLTLAILTIIAIGNMLVFSTKNKHAFLLTGFLGGFTSSTATVIAMANLVKEQSTSVHNAAAAATASSVATYIQMAVLIGLISPALLYILLTPLIAGALVGALLSWLLYQQADKTKAYRAGSISFGAMIKKSLLIVLMLTVMLTLISLAKDILGDKGVNVAAFLSGLADGHASAISISELVSLNIMLVNQASIPVLLGLTSNTIMRGLFCALSQNRSFIMYVTGSLFLSILTTWLVFWLI